MNLAKIVERDIEQTFQAKGVAIIQGCRGPPGTPYVSTATTKAHYEKAVPEAVLKGMRLPEEKAAARPFENQGRLGYSRPLIAC
jgi:hypothetical protein